MRIMIKFSFPPDSGNDIVGSGKIGKIFENLMADLKPEAAYFYPEGGDRGGVFFVDLKESTDVMRSAEPLWLGLNAKVEMIPVMAAEDLMKGMPEMPAMAARYR